METVAKNVYSAITNAIDDFASLIAQQHNLDKQLLINEWNKRAESDVGLSSKSKPKLRKTSKPIEQDTEESLVSLPNCNYICVRGKEKGQQCTIHVVSADAEFCKKHVESGAKAKTKALNPTKITKKEIKAKVAVEERSSAPPVIKTLASKAEVHSIRRNQYDNYEDTVTNFVFNTNKHVVGKQVGDKVIQLTDNDLELCKQKKFLYELPSIIVKKEEDVDEVEEETEEEAEEDGVEYEEVEVTDDES